MIKRYSFGVRSSNYDDPFESKIIIDQIEAEDGEWVRWEDVDKLIGYIYDLECELEDIDDLNPSCFDLGLQVAKATAFCENRSIVFDFDTQSLVDATTGEVLYKRDI